MNLMSNSQGAKRIRLLHELLLSIYFPLLIFSVHEREPGGRWAIRLVYWAVSHGYLRKNVGIEDDRIFYADFLLVWSLIVFLFLVLRLIAVLFRTQVVLHVFAPVVALLGYPLALLYVRQDLRLFLYFELGATALCALLWAYRRWFVSARVSFALLFLHYLFWATLGGGPSLRTASWIAIWPSWYLRPGASGIFTSNLWLVYPVLGILSSLLWAAYFRQSEQTKEGRSAGAPE
jgi:hypothetical protein